MWAELEPRPRLSALWRRRGARAEAP
jgi:hypothetical protein